MTFNNGPKLLKKNKTGRAPAQTLTHRSQAFGPKATGGLWGVRVGASVRGGAWTLKAKVHVTTWYIPGRLRPYIGVCVRATLIP